MRKVRTAGRRGRCQCGGGDDFTLVYRKGAPKLPRATSIQQAKAECIQRELEAGNVLESDMRISDG